MNIRMSYAPHTGDWRFDYLGYVGVLELKNASAHWEGRYLYLKNYLPFDG